MLASGDEVLDRGQHAVARAALGERDPLVVEAALGEPGIARDQEALVGVGTRGVARQPARVVVAVAPREGPADVVQQDQGQEAVAGLLAHQPQLLAHGEVVVVAIDDHRIGQVQCGEGGVAGLHDQLELGAALGELGEPGPRGGVDRGDPLGAVALGPGEQLAREEPVLGPDLGDRARARSIEAGEDDLAHVRERAVEAVQ